MAENENTEYYIGTYGKALFPRGQQTKWSMFSPLMEVPDGALDWMRPI